MALCIYILVAYFRTQERSIEAGIEVLPAGGLLQRHPPVRHQPALRRRRRGHHEPEGAHRDAGPGPHVQQPAGLHAASSWCWWASASRWRRCPSTCGAPTPTTAPPRPSPPSCPWPPRRPPWRPSCGSSAPASAASTSDWAAPLAFVAGASMVLGNIAALRQQTMKRLLAYSSIAHVGYMLLGVLCSGVPGGVQAIWLYMLTYLLMQSGAFAIVIYLQGKGEGERIEDFRGLAKHPARAGLRHDGHHAEPGGRSAPGGLLQQVLPVQAGHRAGPRDPDRPRPPHQRRGRLLLPGRGGH